MKPPQENPTLLDKLTCNKWFMMIWAAFMFWTAGSSTGLMFVLGAFFGIVFTLWAVVIHVLEKRSAQESC